MIKNSPFYQTHLTKYLQTILPEDAKWFIFQNAFYSEHQTVDKIQKPSNPKTEYFWGDYSLTALTLLLLMNWKLQVAWTS